MEPSEQVLQQHVLDLLARRDPGATICPSEVTRLHPGEWRTLMEPVRAAAAVLVAHGLVIATRGGAAVDPLAPGGPIRLGRGPRFTDDHRGTGDER